MRKSKYTELIHRISRSAAVLIVCVLIAFSTAASGEDNPDIAAMEKIIFSNFASGDYFALYESVEKMLLRFPAAPESYLYYFDLARLADISGYKRVEQSLKTLARSVRERGGEHANLYELIIKLELEKLLSRHAGAAAEEYSGGLFSVRTWLVMGPYSKYGAGDLEHAFIPEIAGRFEDRSIRKKTVTVKRHDGVLDLEEQLFPRRGVAYAFTTLKTRGTLKLRIYSKAHYKLFINGQAALSNLPAGEHRYCRIVRVQARGPVSLMMKMYNSGEWKFRIIVTDDTDRTLPVESGTAEIATAACEFTEVFDHPYYEFISRLPRDRAGASFKIGSFFEELDSREAVRFYRQSLAQGFSPEKKYFLARCLISNSNGDGSSATAMEGRRLMTELAEMTAGYIPARQWRFSDFIERKETREAYKAGRDLVGQAPRYLPAWRDYCRFLGTLPSDNEFIKEAAAFSAQFPDSPVPSQVMAEFYRDRNTDRCVEICRSILKTGYDRQAFETLLEVYKKRERYEDALRLIDLHDYSGVYENDRTNILITSGRYEEAKKRIFRTMIDGEDPNAHVRLGLISYLRNEDPVMHWSRALIMDPSNFSVGDLLESVIARGMDHPFAGKRPVRGEDHVVSAFLNPPGGAYSRVMLRGKVFQFNHDGSSRAFFEEVIYVNDQKGIDRWGEYRIDQSGEIHPIRVRIYAPDGSHADSYSMEKIDGANYINLPTLREKSVIHISYYIDNPFASENGSGFISVPFTAIQDFDEPVDNFYLQVIAPKDMPVHFSCSEGIKTESEKSGANVLYSIRLKNLPALKKEEYMGSGLLKLPYFAMSTFGSAGDFVRWYNGMIADAFSLDSTAAGYDFSGKDINEITEKVYLKISRDIDLAGHVLYYPEKAADTAFRKRGTVEDKVILAKAALERLGIRSYIAFSQRRDFPRTGEYISPDIFSHILLYVPVSINEGIFLDFYNRYGTYGVVDPSIEGTEALILLRDGYEMKSVNSLFLGGVRSQYDLSLDSRGRAAFKMRMEFYGSRGTSRSYFGNKTYRQEVLTRLVAQTIPAPAVDEYRVENLESAAEPLRIFTKGSCHGISIPFKNRLLLKPVLTRSSVMNYILSPRRNYPLVIDEAINESESYTFRLPVEWAGSALAENYSYQCTFGYASISMRKAKGSSELIVLKEVHVPPVRIDPGRYAEFLDFCQKLDAGEARRIILEK